MLLLSIMKSKIEFFSLYLTVTTFDLLMRIMQLYSIEKDNFFLDLEMQLHSHYFFSHAFDHAMK